MFHAAKAILFTMGVKAKTHKGVISSFGEHIVKKGILGKQFADKDVIMKPVPSLKKNWLKEL